MALSADLTLVSISPASFANGVNMPVTIIGSNMDTATSAMLGTVALRNLEVISSTQATALVPWLHYTRKLRSESNKPEWTKRDASRRGDYKRRSHRLDFQRPIRRRSRRGRPGSGGCLAHVCFSRWLGLVEIPEWRRQLGLFAGQALSSPRPDRLPHAWTAARDVGGWRRRSGCGAVVGLRPDVRG